jgi:hypothetical protein
MLLSFAADAERVEVEKAEKIARSHIRSTRRTALHDLRLSKTVTKPIVRKRAGEQNLAPSQRRDEPMFYVFSATGGGFVIVAGDDAAKPVLGYSDSGTYDENNPHLAYWMEMLSQEIADAVENGASRDDRITAEWETLSDENERPVNSSGDYVDPLIKTKWDQSAPYNNLCPQIAGVRTVTGCVATAMAQIMKYHEYPTSRDVAIPGYRTPIGINIAAVEPATYQWNLMTDVYTVYSGETADAVAKLMYDCGVSVKMDYNTAFSTAGGSGAFSSDVVPALTAYFDYDAGMSYHERSYYSYSEWINLLKTELKARRPIYYSGFSSGGGHAFVCDGYDVDNLFHFNWGWGGISDGYFEISALDPYSLGTGGGSGGYNHDQAIVAGICPDKGGYPPVQLKLSTFTASTTALNSLTEPFNLTAERLTNIGSGTVGDVYLGILLYGPNDDCYDHKTALQTLDLQPQHYHDETELLSGYSLPSGLSAGTYRLYPAFSASSGIPSVIPAADRNRYITVTVENDGTVALSSDIATSDLSLISLKTVGNLYRNRMGIFEAEIGNSGTADYNSVLRLRLGSQNVVTEPTIVPAGTTKTVRLAGKITLSPSDYLATVWYDANSVNMPSVQLGDAVTVEVKAEPAAPELSLVATPSFANGSESVPQNTPNLTVTLKNAGGIYVGNVSVDIYQHNSSSIRLGTFGAVYVSIDSGETEEIHYNNPLDFLTTGKQYDAYVYADGYDHAYPKFTFTLSDPVYSSDATLKRLVVKNINTQTELVLIPDFAPATTGYLTSAGSVDAVISIVGEANHRRSTFSNIENRRLNDGDNHFHLEVTAEDGTIMIYRVNVTTEILVNAQTPTVTAHPQSAVYTVGATAAALTVTASADGTLSYQWYSNTIDSNAGGSAIVGETSTNYTPSSATVGTGYYYVRVTNTDTGDNITGSPTAVTTSNVATITVNKISQSAPKAPTVADKTATSITLAAVADNMEYCKDGENWQNSPIFTGLVPNTGYTFYARMKETDMYSASPSSAGVSVTTYAGLEAKLLNLTVNNDSISIAGNDFYYQSKCDETSINLKLEKSVAASATVTANGVIYDYKSQNIPLSRNITFVNITIVSGNNKAIGNYVLRVSKTFAADDILFRRWDDVLAVNRNSDGKYDIESVRWHIDGRSEILTDWYITMTEDVTNYHAEVSVDGVWHNVCGVPKTETARIIAYPNPVSTGTNLNVLFPDSFTGGYMNILNLAGSTVKQKLPLPNTVSVVSVSDLPPGVYLLKIVAPNGDSESVKIIVSR